MAKTKKDPEKNVEKNAETNKDAKKAEDKNTAVEKTVIIEDAPQISLQDKYDEIYDKYLRLAAEYDNFRKRTDREKSDLAAYATARTVEKLLPVLDNLDKASQNKGEDIKAFGDGIDMITKNFTDILNSAGVKEIEALGKEFNPELHNAISTEESDGDNENIVVEVYQKGYAIDDKVIRHAIVKVAK